MKRFKNVVSLNYDLIPYWAMLRGNEEISCTWFKDGFINNSGREFAGDIEFLRRPHGNCNGSTILFYPHGNLILAQENGVNEIKLRRTAADDLLEIVLRFWKIGFHVPLFVSEGTSEKKKEAINRSRYLNTVYHEILPKMEKSLVIYGWSMGAQDEHILRELAACNLEKIAVSVNSGGNRGDAYCQRVTQKLRDIGAKKIDFFRAGSEGCWIY